MITLTLSRNTSKNKINHVTIAIFIILKNKKNIHLTYGN